MPVVHPSGPETVVAAPEPCGSPSTPTTILGVSAAAQPEQVSAREPDQALSIAAVAEATTDAPKPTRQIALHAYPRHYCASITGSSHRRSGKVGQDAGIAASHHLRGSSYTVMALADGHGSAQYVRSDLGAHFAVLAAQECAANFILALDTNRADKNPSDLRFLFGDRFPRQLREAWLRHVNQHLADHPLDSGFEGDTTSAYGTTLVLAVLVDDSIFVGRIGDSSAHRVRTDAVYEALVTDRSDGHTGLTTHSLSSANCELAWDFRHLAANETAMLALMTDGLSDSSGNLPLLIENLRKAEGASTSPQAFADHLPAILEYYSREGVGDDTSLALWINNQTSQEPTHEPDKT